jgi:cytochrome c-type biogenesis protein CcmH/NrfF
LAKHELSLPAKWEEECQVEETAGYNYEEVTGCVVQAEKPGELTKEVYEKLIAEGLTKTQIMKKYGYRPQGFYVLLEKWGLHQRQKRTAASKPKIKPVAKAISITEALKRREKAIKNLRCIEDILESQAEVTDDVKATLNDLCRQYKEDVGRINKALEQVKIAL